MKILCLLGSPRKGNSTAIATRFCETAEKSGATVKTYTLNKLTYKGCQACMTCKTKLEKCVLKDDLTEVLEAVYDSDVLVMATPIYYGEVSSQLKAFIDRTFSFLKPDYITNPDACRLPKGKKLVFIQTQADPNEKNYADVFPRYDFFFKWYGFSKTYLIRCCGVLDKGDIEKRSDILKQAETIALELNK